MTACSAWVLSLGIQGLHKTERERERKPPHGFLSHLKLPSDHEFVRWPVVVNPSYAGPPDGQKSSSGELACPSYDLSEVSGRTDAVWAKNLCTERRLREVEEGISLAYLASLRSQLVKTCHKQCNKLFKVLYE